MNYFFSSLRFFLPHLSILIIMATSGCNKDDNDDAPSGDTEASAFVVIGSNHWNATSFQVLTSSVGPAINFTNSGETVFNTSLKSTYPQLTETLGLYFFTNDIHVGRYIFKYGPGTQGSSELAIYKDQSKQSYADSLYKLEELLLEGTDYYVDITKVEKNKISGSFYLFLFQPITGATSLKILKCEGTFKNVPFY